jgi:hypothetical protein
MKKNIFLSLFILLLIFTSTAFASDFTKMSLVSPMFIRASETDTMFRNPADLTLYDRVLDLRFSYGLKENRFGGLFLLHLPDNIPIYSGGKKDTLSLGDFGFSMEVFGTDFSQNLMWIENDEDDEGGHFSLAEGGYRMLFTWAKKTKFLTFGTNLKVYKYRDLNDTTTEINATGLDVGMYLTPFKDLYLGAVVNDVGSTVLRDSSNQAIYEDGKKQTIAQEVRLTAAVISGKDMGFSVGIPVKLIEHLRNDTQHPWRTISFQGTKVFDNFLAIAAGSNTKDLYGSISILLNNYMDIGIIGSQGLYGSKEIDYTLTFSLGYPVEKFLEHLGWLHKTKKSPFPPQIYHKTRNDQRIQSKRKTNKLTNKKRIKKLEKRLNNIETRKQLPRVINDIPPETPYKLPSEEQSAYKEIEDELNTKINKLQKKKSTLKKLKKKDEIKRQLDALD